MPLGAVCAPRSRQPTKSSWFHTSIAMQSGRCRKRKQLRLSRPGPLQGFSISSRFFCSRPSRALRGACWACRGFSISSNAAARSDALLQKFYLRIASTCGNQFALIGQPPLFLAPATPPKQPKACFQVATLPLPARNVEKSVFLRTLQPNSRQFVLADCEVQACQAPAWQAQAEPRCTRTWDNPH
jgi:hypothetical protein